MKIFKKNGWQNFYNYKIIIKIYIYKLNYIDIFYFYIFKYNF